MRKFADNGISGAKGRDKRPGFNRLLKAVVRREIDVVAVWSVNCLGRSSRHLVGFLEELDGAGCDLYLHQQSLDTTTPAGRAMFRMLGVFSEFERSIIRSRLKARLARARLTDQKAASRLGSSAGTAEGRGDPRRTCQGYRHHQDSTAVQGRCICSAADEARDCAGTR